MGKFYFGKQGGNYVRFNNETVMEIIPHRQPFLLIDTVEELESGYVPLQKNVSATMSHSLADIFQMSRYAGRTDH